MRSRGAGRTLLLLGVALVALVAALLWFVLGDDDGARRPGDRTTIGGSAQGGAGAPGRPRARTEGTSSIAGCVLLRRAGAPAPGETVALVREGEEDRTVATDAGGGFVFERLGDGGPYEVRVAAR